MNMRHQGTMVVCGVTLIWATLSFAGGGKVTYPDGRPVAGAQVNIRLNDIDRYTLSTDASGLFALPAKEFEDALIQIKAPDSQKYGTVSLPAKLFTQGTVRVVLQPDK